MVCLLYSGKYLTNVWILKRFKKWSLVVFVMNKLIGHPDLLLERHLDAGSFLAGACARLLRLL